MDAFFAQLGKSENQGLFTDSERLQSLKRNRNPFITGNSLNANSGVFFGRKKELFTVLASLRQPNNPASVSLVGERRIGKSSLLNQLYQALAKEDKLISIQTSTQNWAEFSAEDFFKSLQVCLTKITNVSVDDDGDSAYEQCRDFIQFLAQNHHYRFVLLIDEFEKMAGNPKFNAEFFSHLRGMGDTACYQFGFVISSRRELKSLCRQEKIEASEFWNIFGNREILGLLTEKDAKDLLIKPFQKTLNISISDDGWLKVKKMTGCHPLLIQLFASDYWNAKVGGFDMDEIEIKMNLRRYLEDWFYQRSEENPRQWQVLVQAAGGKKVKENSTFHDLYLRGLVLKEGTTFCPYFAKVIEEECEEKSNRSFKEILKEMVDGLEQGVDIVGKLYGIFMKGAVLSGKIQQSISQNGDN